MLWSNKILEDLFISSLKLLNSEFVYTDILDKFIFLKSFFKKKKDFLVCQHLSFEKKKPKK